MPQSQEKLEQSISIRRWHWRLSGGRTGDGGDDHFDHAYELCELGTLKKDPSLLEESVREYRKYFECHINYPPGLPALRDKQGHFGEALHRTGLLKKDVALLMEARRIIEWRPNKETLGFRFPRNIVGNIDGKIGDLNKSTVDLENSMRSYEENIDFIKSERYLAKKGSFNASWADDPFGDQGPTPNNPLSYHEAVLADNRHGLGFVLSKLGSLKKDPDLLKKSIKESSAALAVQTRDKNDTVWADARHNLGFALCELGILIRKPSLVKEGITNLQAALEVNDPYRWGDTGSDLKRFEYIQEQLFKQKRTQSSAGYEPSISSFGSSLYNDDDSSIAPRDYLQDGCTWKGSVQTSPPTRFGVLRNWKQSPEDDLKRFFAQGGDYRTTIDERNQTVAFSTTYPDGTSVRVRTHRSNIAATNANGDYAFSPLWDPIVRNFAGSRTGILSISHGENQGWVVQEPTRNQVRADRMSLDGRPSSIVSESGTIRQAELPDSPASRYRNAYRVSQGERTPAPSVRAPSVAGSLSSYRSDVPPYDLGDLPPRSGRRTPSVFSMNSIATTLPDYVPLSETRMPRSLPLTPRDIHEQRQADLRAEIAEAQERNVFRSDASTSPLSQSMQQGTHNSSEFDEDELGYPNQPLPPRQSSQRGG